MANAIDGNKKFNNKIVLIIIWYESRNRKMFFYFNYEFYTEKMPSII